LQIFSSVMNAFRPAVAEVDFAMKPTTPVAFVHM